MRFCVSLTAFLLSLVAPAQASPACPEPGSVIFPLGKLIEKEGLALEFDFERSSYPKFGSPEQIKQQRDTVLANLAGKSPAEHDALLLGRLSWSTISTIPLLGVTTFGDAGLFDTYLEVLERHDMTEHASVLKAVRAAFPVWETTAQNRYDQWNLGGQQLNLALDGTLRRQSEMFVNAQPPLLNKAEEILKGDPVYESYLAKREAADQFDLHIYMMGVLLACIPPYDTPRAADAALASVPQTVADLHVADLFLLEASNGGMHQYIFNSTGMLAPQLADMLTRWGLPAGAQAVHDTMAYFPVPYPRDTQKRRAIMAEFDPATNDAVNCGTWIADSIDIYDKIQEIAERDGYWPR